MEDICWWNTTLELEWRQPVREDDLWGKMTFDGRQTLTEDDLSRKTTFDRRQPLIEDDLWRKTTIDRRRPLMEDDLWRKMIFNWRRPLTEDDLQWKTTFDRVTVYYLKEIFTTPPLDSHSTTDPIPVQPFFHKDIYWQKYRPHKDLLFFQIQT